MLLRATRSLAKRLMEQGTAGMPAVLTVGLGTVLTEQVYVKAACAKVSGEHAY